MQKNKYLTISLLIALSLAFAVYAFFALQTNYVSTEKLLRFNYIVKNDSEKLVADARFIAAIPMQIDGVQSIQSINASYEYQVTDNRFIEFPLKNITPYSSKIIDLTLVVSLTNKPKTKLDKTTEYLQSQKYIETEIPEVKELAAQLKGKAATDTAKNIHQWLVNNIELSSYTADSKGAAYLLKNKTGDCTEFMYAFIALARANGIPSRGVSGFWIPGESSLINAADYHDWAEFYDGDRWVLVDSSKQVFDSENFNYITGSLFDPDEHARWKFDSTGNQLTVSQ